MRGLQSPLAVGLVRAHLPFSAAFGLAIALALPGVANAGADDFCGNGMVDVGELCDDGNTVNADGCSFPSCLPEVCGDGIVNPDVGEWCDDGNTVDFDGCGSDCLDSHSMPAAQQKCINAINADGARVLDAQNRENAKCLKAVAGGKSAVGICLGKDATGKVGKAGAKTTKTADRKCTGQNTPTRYFTDASSVNAAAAAGANDALTTILGDPPAIAPEDDREGSGCQSEVLERLRKLQSAWAKEANGAKKAALKHTSDVATAVEAAVAASAKIASAENGVKSRIAKKCPDAVVDESFDCDGAATSNQLALCVIAAAERGACSAMEAADDVDLDCPGDAGT